jgi:hypothetical protein
VRICCCRYVILPHERPALPPVAPADNLIGGLIFFGCRADFFFRTACCNEPDVVRNSLIALHWMGMSAGAVFLACSVVENRFSHGYFSLFRPIHLLVFMMLALTAISQFRVIPRLDALRATAGDIAQLSATDPVRLHSTRCNVVCELRAQCWCLA